MKINKKALKLAILGLVLITKFNSVNAEQLRFAVSPSKLDEIQIEKGESKQIDFTVGNRTVCDEANNGKFTFSVECTARLENDLGQQLDVANLVSIPNNLVTCSPMNYDTISTIINIPKDFEENCYTLYISFTRKPINQSSAETQNIATITVPVYMFVGDESKWNKEKPLFKITSNKFSANGYEPNNVKGYVKTWLKKIPYYNPIKTVDTFRQVKTYPLYYTEDLKYVDFNDKLFTTGDMLMSNRQTDWKYIPNVSEELIKTIVYKDNDILIEDVKGNTFKIGLNETSMLYTQQQLKQVTNYKSYTVKQLIEMLRFPVNRNYNIPSLDINTEFTECSSRTNNVNGVISFGSDELKPLENISSMTLPPKRSEYKHVSLDYTNIKFNNKNLLRINAKGLLNEESNELIFLESDRLRTNIFKWTLIVYMIIMTTIALMLLLIYNYLKPIYTEEINLVQQDENLLVLKEHTLKTYKKDKKVKGFISKHRNITKTIIYKDIRYTKLSVFACKTSKEESNKKVIVGK